MALSSRAGRAISPATGCAASKEPSSASISSATAESRAFKGVLGFCSVMRGFGCWARSHAYASAGRQERAIMVDDPIAAADAPYGAAMSLPATSRSEPGPARRLLRRAVLLMAAILLLPYALTPLYLVVKPVSTPMIWRWITGARVERSYVALAAM